MGIIRSTLNVCFSAWANGIPNALGKVEMLYVVFVIHVLNN